MPPTEADAPSNRRMALLLTDVVDSTRLAEALGDARMAALWAAHDRIARDLLRSHGGTEIDKTDGFLLLFDAARDALAYATAYHDAIGTLDPPITARAGLHVGDVVLRHTPEADVARGAKPLEVYGQARPMVARIMSLAGPGRTLLSAAARAEVDSAATSHGHWRMKGVDEPVELFGIGPAPLPPADGPKGHRVVRDGDGWLPVAQVRHNLPAERDAFVGRASDLRELAARIDEGARLVSVLGTAGTGKTRLVTRFGWSWQGDYPGGVWFCDLSEARSVDGILYAVASALEVPLGVDDPVQQLGHAIAGRGRCLLVLDNFEQVARHAGETIGRWLDGAPEAHFVVTSREVLGLSGETVLALAPLAAAEAVALFVTRAEQAKRGFSLTASDEAQVAGLVRLLDGLPLAIELAAARVRLMPPKMLLERMSERFRLLAGGRRSTRQSTLRAALDWSWDLLTPDERSALAQLSVFEGGFTLEAAEAVLALESAWPADAVQALVDKSLVQPRPDERFDLLVSVQEYATERLVALGEADAATARHGDHYALHGTDDLLAALQEHGGADRLRLLARDLDNLVAACRRAILRGDGATATNTLRAAWVVLDTRGPFRLGAELATAVRGIPSLTEAEVVAVDLVLGDALHELGRSAEATRWLEEASELASRAGNRRQHALVRLTLGRALQREGRTAEARAHYEAALASFRETGDERVTAVAISSLGMLDMELGRLTEARAHMEAALALSRRVGDRRNEGVLLGNLAGLDYHAGRLEQARAHVEAALAVQRELENRPNEGITLGYLAILARALGRPEEGRAHHEAALAIHREVGSRHHEAVELGNLGDLHGEAGRLDEAVAHYEQALALAREIGDRHYEGIVLGSLGRIRSEQHDPDAARACWDVGQRLLEASGDRIELGKLLADRAAREAALHPAEARVHLAAAERLLQEIGAPPESALGALVARARAALG